MPVKSSHCLVSFGVLGMYPFGETFQVPEFPTVVSLHYNRSAYTRTAQAPQHVRIMKKKFEVNPSKSVHSAST